jgi:hypothetical protein
LGSLNGRRLVLVRKPLVGDAQHANNMVQRIPSRCGPRSGSPDHGRRRPVLLQVDQQFAKAPGVRLSGVGYDAVL